MADKAMYGMNAAAIPFDGINKYLRITDIDDNSRRFKANPLTSPNGEIEEKYQLKVGDIVFTRTGASVGKSYLYNPNDGKLLFAGFLIKFSIINANPYFVFSQTLKSNYNKWVQKMSMRSGQPGINAEEYKDLELAFPAISEQDKISSFLSLIDNRIECQSKIIEGLMSFKDAVSKKIFSQEFRLKDENGEEFPEWEEKNGGDLFDSISNKNHNSDLPILAISQEFGAVPREMINYQISVTDKSIESYKVVEIGDFIISLRSFQGGIEYSNYKGICSPAYIILRAKTLIDNTFYKYYFKTDFYIQQLCSKLEGIRDGKMISYKYFSEIGLPFPSIAEQAKIADFLSSIDEKIEPEKKILQQYKNQKAYLLQNMFV